MIFPNPRKAFWTNSFAVTFLQKSPTTTVRVRLGVAVHFLVSSQGTTLDNPQEDTIPNVNKQSDTLTESGFSMEELELARLIHSALMTDYSALAVSSQQTRDYVNTLRFIQFALSQRSSLSLQEVYSLFAESSEYVQPFVPRKSSFEQFMSTMNTPPLSPQKTPLSPQRPKSTTLVRSIPPSLSSLLLPHALSSYASLPEGDRIFQSQFRAIITSIHCPFDIITLQRFTLSKQLLSALPLTHSFTISNSIAMWRSRLFDAPTSISSSLFSLYFWYHNRFPTIPSPFYLLLPSLPSILLPKEKGKRGRPRKLTPAEQEKAAENARISVETSVMRSLLLLELLRELARVERKNGFDNLAGKVNEWLTSCWSEKCVLAGNPALWKQGQLLLVVGENGWFYWRESWKK